MFSSLASFLFGSTTNCETNSEATATATVTGAIGENDTNIIALDSENFIQVSSLTPSVTGDCDRGEIAIKRGKHKRNHARQQNKRKDIKEPLPHTVKETTPITHFNFCGEDKEELNEDDWIIIEKENDKENLTFACTDSEGEILSVVEVVETTKKPVDAAVASNQLQRFQHINSHSPFIGPRPQKQRNYLRKTRNAPNNRPNKGLSVSTLSPSRTVNDGRNGSAYEVLADSGITQSLYEAATTPFQVSDDDPINQINVIEMASKMDESWFVTPPPCFSSIGPIILETSPYENLLIEHPSMSVYHTIRKAEETAHSFIKPKVDVSEKKVVKQKPNESTSKKNSQAVQTRSSGLSYHLDRQNVILLKQELMARNVQKVQTKRERRDICRSALQRANRVRDIQSRNHTKRRSDNQHSKVFSNANNNRKSNCY